MNVNLNPAQQEKALKLELRLAQIAKNEGCQENFFGLCPCDVARVYRWKAS